ncbi:MAG TPA: acyltransferase family protein [Candidatus Saccharimonadales bacterium]|nr:acyltransferase family protein [Candidatus Saccharimonadales bacterium]
MTTANQVTAEGAVVERSLAPARWFWLDWLRVIAMGTIFLFHSSRPFAPPPWHVMNSSMDLGFTLFDAFISGWIMPLFFVISGIAVYSSLRKRSGSASQFLKDRFLRLMVPFLSVGLLIILSVNVYFDAVFHGNYTGDFLSFYLGPYFTKFFPFDLNFSSTYFANSNQGIYLWYLFWLFMYSLVTFPFFKWLAKEVNRDRLSKLYAACNRPGGTLLLAIPVIIVNIAAVPPYFVFPSGYGGWKLPPYLMLFIIAYVMASSPQFEESIEKNRTISLMLGIVLSIIIIAIAASTGGTSPSSGIDSSYVAVSTIWALNGWCWVTAILGFGRKYLSFNHKYLKVSNELVLPFYILHQSIIVAVAFYVVGLDLIVIEKYLLIVVLSFPLIVALLYPISKVNVLRFLFGMRMKNRSSTRASGV